MKSLYTKIAISAALAFSIGATAAAETVNIGGSDYEMNTVIDRELAPGVQYLRLRMPDYPLNINLLKVDVSNPKVKVETTVAKESSRGTELLTDAASRLASDGHKPVAAANGNFWALSSQTPDGGVFSGITRNASVRNGKIVTESNQYLDKWGNGVGTTRSGVVCITDDGKVYADSCTSAIRVTIGNKKMPVHLCNKGPKPGELCMYNSFYGEDTEFMPIRVVDNADNKKWYEKAPAGKCTEVLLDLKEGESWMGGREIRFQVKEVRSAAGTGTLGKHDLALVGNGNMYSEYYFKDVRPGDEVTLEYHWTFENNGVRVQPVVAQAIGGNAMVMRAGELTIHNSNEDYNSMVYSRTGYGCSEDNKTLYVIVIDKSTDPVYGKSAGCSTAVMSEIARHFGCWNLSNFDAGGSAEMMVDGEIINKTTESTPRPVANALMIFSAE